MIRMEVVLSPALLHLSDMNGKNVLVIDILRATSTICTAIHEGALSVRAVRTPEEALEYRSKGYLAAAERDGMKLEGFDLGNSPFECMDGQVRGRKIALTTTNGTKCIEAVSNDGAAHVLCGSFLNLDALTRWLINDHKDVILLCAGWKDSFNLEDALFAGALATELQKNTETDSDCDATHMSMDIYRLAAPDPASYLKKSSHYKRLSHLHHEEDMKYCLQQSVFQTITLLVGNEMKKI